MTQIRVKIVILIFEINNSLNHDTRIVRLTLNHDSRIEIVNLILNQDKKIDHSFLNHDTIANRIVFAIVNTNSQSTQLRDYASQRFGSVRFLPPRNRTGADSIFWWFRFGSVRFGSGFHRFETIKKSTKSFWSHA
jgi:hypothetical protein